MVMVILVAAHPDTQLEVVVVACAMLVVVQASPRPCGGGDEVVGGSRLVLGSVRYGLVWLEQDGESLLLPGVTAVEDEGGVEVL